MTMHSIPEVPPERRLPRSARLLSSAGALALLAACAGALAASQGPAAAPELLQARDTLRQPTVVSSERGELRATLRVVMARLPVVNANPDASSSHPDTTVYENLRAYQLMSVNGRAINETPRFPGPTFRVRPGDLVRITLINDLPPDPLGNDVCEPYPASLPRVDSVRHIAQPAADQYEDCFHGSNYTNIHYHGMHVTPDSTGDNVFLLIAPGDTFHYSFRIPHNQSPGTHWYHPHKHGSVALQVTNGMAGGFIVEGGGLDSLTQGLTPATGFVAMRERLIAIQQVDPNVNLIDNDVAQAPLVNGQYVPEVRMYPDEVQRWRIVNENVSNSANYSVLFENQAQEPSMYDVARDGVQYAPANYDAVHPDTALDISPGNRLDVFVQAPSQVGVYNFVARRDTAIRAGRPELRLQATNSTPPLLRVRVIPRPRVRRGHPPVRYVSQLPAQLPPLPAFLANLQPLPADTAARIVFTETGKKGGFNPGHPRANPPSYFLGTTDYPFMKFNHNVVFMQMPLDSTHIWKVINRSPNRLNHPFHIHINPFQVLRVHAPDATDSNQWLYQQLNDASGRGSPIWLDVIALPLPRKDASGAVVEDGYVVIAQRYENFTGSYVMHCHILGHEERGMMQTLQVVTEFNNGLMPAPGATSGGGHSHHR